MFDAVRNNKRIVQGFLLLITLPFAFWGIDSYVRGGPGGATVATVGDFKISQAQFQQSLHEQKNQLQQRLGAQFDPKMLDQPGLRQELLNQLINQNLLLQEASNLHLYASDVALRQLIVGIPAFQENGKFSKARYEAMLQTQGMTPEGFEQQVRRDLTIQQLLGTLGDSSFVPLTVAKQVAAIQSETRQVQELVYSADQYLNKVKLTTAEVESYYAENRKQFELPEQVKTEFVVLSGAALRAQLSISDSEVKAFYEANKSRYQEAEQRRASHILILLDEKASDADKAKAKEKAETLLKEVNANPSKFAAVARQNSQDPGSATQGGDLGFFSSGMMVKPFEEAVWRLKEGEISSVVQSDFGFHIIRLTGIKGGKAKPLDVVKFEIEAELRQQALTRKLAESVEAFGNMVYEQSDSLQPAADKFHLAIQRSGWISKINVPQGSPLANPKLLAELFSDDAVKLHRNTQAIEVSKDTLISARVVEYKPAEVQLLEAVRTSIEQKLKQKEALALAKSASEAALKLLQSGASVNETWSPVREVSRLNPRAIPAPAITPVFKLSTDKLPAYTTVELPIRGFAIYKLSKVSEGSMNEGERKRFQSAVQQQLQSMMAQEDVQSYLQALRQRYKVEINTSALLDNVTDK
jgi:peptidyl-prolyl cis-trans isomerase D